MKLLLFGVILLVPFFCISQDTAFDPERSVKFQADSVVAKSADSIPKQIQKPVRKKWVAALLAFPLVGITGAHRVYLGTEPWMPLVYLGTLGGFGILPLIDFFVILFTPKEKLERYFDDPKVFMWGE